VAGCIEEHTWNRGVPSATLRRATCTIAGPMSITAGSPAARGCRIGAVHSVERTDRTHLPLAIRVE
jgi:hypothetical protein